MSTQTPTHRFFKSKANNFFDYVLVFGPTENRVFYRDGKAYGHCDGLITNSLFKTPESKWVVEACESISAEEAIALRPNIAKAYPELVTKAVVEKAVENVIEAEQTVGRLLFSPNKVVVTADSAESSLVKAAEDVCRENGPALQAALNELEGRNSAVTPAKTVTPAIRIPEPQRFLLRYRKANGKVETYQISLPIESDADQVTTYAFGKGVRTFKVSGIQEIREVGRSLMNQ